MIEAIIALSLLAVIGGGVLWFARSQRQAGEARQRAEQAAADIAARDRVAAAGAGPRGPGEVEDALRRGGF